MRILTASEIGRFENRKGYSLVKIRDVPYFFFFTKAIYEFTLDADAPLTFVHPNGRRFQPDRHCETDMGSIPIMLQWLFPKDRFLLSYLFHDSAWRHGGLYVRSQGREDFCFVKMTKYAANRLLEQMVMAEGAMAGAIWIIGRAVDGGAFLSDFRSKREKR